MKSTDIALIIFIAAVSVVVSYFIGNAILGDPSEKVEQITYIRDIDTNIEQPDLETFNIYSYNPTVDVHIGRCEVGQVYIAETKECRTISADDIKVDVNKPDEEE